MIKPKSGGSTQRELIPSGSHVARCYSMVHIGTVQWEYLGEVKHTDKVRITWELPLETKEFKEGDVEKPFVISNEYTLSMNEKANLRKDLESWRGKGFTEKEADDFDITKLLGVKCMINVVHKEAKNGNTYSNVGGVSPIPKGMDCPAQINETFEFNFDDKFNLEWLATQPEFIKDMITSTPEYRGRMDEMEHQEQVKKEVVVDAIQDNKELPF